MKRGSNEQKERCNMPRGRLSNEEKKQIQIGIVDKKDLDTIAEELGRKPNTVAKYLTELSVAADKLSANNVQQDSNPKEAKKLAKQAPKKKKKAKKTHQIKAKDKFVTKTDGGNKGVSIMTAGASGDGDKQSLKKSVNPFDNPNIHKIDKNGK